MLFSNRENIPLPLAVWLASDDYDFVGGKNKISATSLIKPIRQFILAGRVPVAERDYDVADFIASRMGHAFHDSIERAWTVGYKDALRKLGYPDAAIERVKVNPDPATVTENDIPVYLEHRSERDINGFTVSGKFDMVLEGELFDTKSTSVWGYILRNNDEKYILQGSIYKWLNPHIISGDQIHIQHIFTDWSRADAKIKPNYPQSRLINSSHNLLSLAETEAYIMERTNKIRKYWNAKDEDIPYCTDEELWRTAPKYKYFSDPNKTDGRSTKNFDDLAEANKYRAEKGKGVVLTELGKVKACNYCQAFNICKQKDNYVFD